MARNKLVKTKARASWKTPVTRLITHMYLSALYRLNKQRAISIIGKSFFRPNPRDLRVDEVDFLKKGEPFNVISHNTTIQGWSYGEGPAILAVHGWASRGGRFAPLHDQLLMHGYKLVVFDGPGHGESEGQTSSYFEMTDAVRAMIHHIGLENIAGLFGHSFGAAAILNAVHKENIRLPVILEAPALRMKKILDESIQKYGVPLSIFHSIISTYEERFGYSIEKDDPILLIQGITNPLLIIHDITDKTTSFKDSKNVATHSKNIQMIETDGYGHSRILTNHQHIQESIDFFGIHLSTNP